MTGLSFWWSGLAIPILQYQLSTHTDFQLINLHQPLTGWNGYSVHIHFQVFKLAPVFQVHFFFFLYPFLLLILLFLSFILVSPRYQHLLLDIVTTLNNVLYQAYTRIWY
jgi:hypothetical protein